VLKKYLCTKPFNDYLHLQTHDHYLLKTIYAKNRSSITPFTTKTIQKTVIFKFGSAATSSLHRAVEQTWKFCQKQLVKAPPATVSRYVFVSLILTSNDTSLGLEPSVHDLKCRRKKFGEAQIISFLVSNFLTLSRSGTSKRFSKVQSWARH